MSRGVLGAANSLGSSPLGKIGGHKGSEADKPGKSPGKGGSKLNMVSHVYTNSSHVSLDSGETVNAGQGAGLGADVASVVRHGSAKSTPVSNTLSNSSFSQGGNIFTKR